MSTRRHFALFAAVPVPGAAAWTMAEGVHNTGRENVRADFQRAHRQGACCRKPPPLPAPRGPQPREPPGQSHWDGATGTGPPGRGHQAGATREGTTVPTACAWCTCPASSSAGPFGPSGPWAGASWAWGAVVLSPPIFQVRQRLREVKEWLARLLAWSRTDVTLGGGDGAGVIPGQRGPGRAGLCWCC